VAPPIGPSTPQQAAYLAWKMGYNPIYFVGYDGCQWRDLSRSSGYDHLGNRTDYPPRPRTADSRIGSSGFQVDTHQLGEKELMLSYLGKKVNDGWLCPGLVCVEVVCLDTPGILELLPRIGLDEFANGGNRNSVKPEQVAAKIRETMADRETML